MKKGPTKRVRKTKKVKVKKNSEFDEENELIKEDIKAINKNIIPK